MVEHKFQINLGGIIDLLSNHLYSSPSVYVRELLQNGVDAITARSNIDETHTGNIELHIGMADTGRPKLIFTDNGIGLTEEETHRFLSTIGESSKRGELSDRNDFIGQFGIGLLSNFVVSDEIVMITKSAKPGEDKVVEWRGRADGTYSTDVRVDESVSPGTTVFLSCKPGCEEWFDVDRVTDLAKQYGALLPFPISIGTDTGIDVINDVAPPWRRTFETQRAEWDAYMSFGKEMFDKDFFDCIPMHSEVGEVEGIAYILPYSPSPTANRAHRVYLKNMLLSETSDNLLPNWAFFVTCIVNTNGLRPTASRESFYEDETLQATREALGDSLREYLIRLKTHDPDRLHALIQLHFRAIKALAVHDDEFCELFIDWLPFETSLGRMSLGDFRSQFDVVRYVPSVDTFRQIAQVAASQSLGIINAGYSYDADLLEKLPRVFPDIEIERIDSTDLAENFEDLTLDEREDALDLVKVGDLVLQPFKCRAEIRKFEPADLPALFLAGDDVNFMRSLEQSKEVADEHWASILTNLANANQNDSYAQLCFNYKNPLIRKLSKIEDRDILRLAIQMLYVQSLLMGHHPLSSKEMALLNTGLIDIIELGISTSGNDFLN